MLSWLLPVLLEPSVEFISPEEKNPIDLVVRHCHSSDAAVHGLSTPAEVLGYFGRTHPRARPGAAPFIGEAIEDDVGAERHRAAPFLVSDEPALRRNLPRALERRSITRPKRVT
jgi:hypothetical protein